MSPNVPTDALATVRRIAEELCRERDCMLTRAVWSEAVNLWFQGYRPAARNAPQSAA